MRSYLIDEVRPSEMIKIRRFLEENATAATLDRIFWVKIPDDLLSPSQSQHPHCQPHAFAVEIGEDWVKMEFLVRSLKTLRCTCPGYSTKRQTQFIINFAHRMIDQVGLKG